MTTAAAQASGEALSGLAAQCEEGAMYEKG